MRKAVLLAIVFALVLPAAHLFAKSGSSRSSSSRSSSHRSSSSGGYGTGSKSSHSTTKGYTKKNGTHVQTYKKTTPDETQKNNYSAKGNYNPHTGKYGTKPAKK